MSTTTTARAWLVIAHGGGRWTIGDVLTALPREQEKTVDNVVRQMAAKGFLKFYEKDSRNTFQRFGVTSECRVPRGLMNWEVLEALGMQLRHGIDEKAVATGMTVQDVMNAMGAWKEAA